MYLGGECGSGQVLLVTDAFLFSTAIVDIFCSETISGILCRDHTSALTAPRKPTERKMIGLFLHARFASFQEHLLHCFKQSRRNNWFKASVVVFAFVICKAEIDAVGKHTGDGSFGRWRSFRGNTMIRQKVGDTT